MRKLWKNIYRYIYAFILPGMSCYLDWRENSSRNSHKFPIKNKILELTPKIECNLNIIYLSKIKCSCTTKTPQKMNKILSKCNAAFSFFFHANKWLTFLPTFLSARCRTLHGRNAVVPCWAVWLTSARVLWCDPGILSEITSFPSTSPLEGSHSSCGVRKSPPLAPEYERENVLSHSFGNIFWLL